MKAYSLSISVFLSLFLPLIVLGQSNFYVQGYVKEMPSVSFSGDFDQAIVDNLLHNRLNFRWQVSQEWRAVFEMRNRIFSGDTPKGNPFFGEMIEQDNGYLNLSKVWKLADHSYLHSMSDRLFVQWGNQDWQIRLGRQRINWGINMVSNPNDLFNTYSFFDFDYEERPGADALRIERYLGGMSRIELAVSPADHISNAVAALLYGTNINGYDVQLISGYFKNRLAIGGGWAGSLGGTGFKGEATFFRDIEPVDSIAPSNLVAAISFDHLFGNGLYVVTEALYNGGNKRQPINALQFLQPLRPDNISFSAFSLTGSAMMPFSPIFSGNLALMYFPDMGAVFAMPGFTWSVITNLDMNFVAQAFKGSENSLFNQGGLACYLGLKWSF